MWSDRCMMLRRCRGLRSGGMKCIKKGLFIMYKTGIYNILHNLWRIMIVWKGWNQYQFETYAPMIKNGYPQDKEASYIRNRNLFYVCCSRPQKRLFFFISVKLDDTFRDFFNGLVGDENIMTYEKYISHDWRNMMRWLYCLEQRCESVNSWELPFHI